jgi:ParB family protein of integrating conjugative element (PFGI_1 class)
VIRFTLGGIKFGVGTAAVAPSDGPAVATGPVTPEAASLAPAAPLDGSVTILRITDIQPYEKNPRQAANPLFDTIKASIRQRGMEAPLKVTRRPGATHYVVAAGGNTRLLAQLQLWQETADPRFEKVPVVIKAWRSESDVLAGHLIENEQRADMSFWDKARGVVALKVELEQERTAALSLRQWESALSDLGLPIGKDVLSTYLFAVERLTPLGPVVPTLSRNDVRDHLQPRFRRLGRLAQKFGLGEVALYAHTLDPVMRRFAEIYQATPSFAAAELAQEGDRALAQTLQISMPTLQAMLALLEQWPELTVTELRTRTAAGTAAAPTETVAITQPPGPRDASAAADPGPVSPGDTPDLPVGLDHNATDAVSRGDRRRVQERAGNRAAGHHVVSPGDSRAIGDAGDATTAPSPEPVEALKRALLGFARMTSCADCLRWQDGLPLDFYVEVPSAPLDLEPASPRRHAGWWLLAFLSGQFDPGLAALLPQGSPWRRALGTEGDWGDERLHLLIHTELGGPLASDALVAWLTRASDAAGESAWQCLQLARRAWGARAPAASSRPPDTAGTP